MQWPTISCVLLACAVVSATPDDSRSKRDLQYWKNLIASNIFGIHPNNNSAAPLLVQDDGNVKIYRVPVYDNLMVRAVPKNPYKIEQAIPVPVEPAVDDPITVLETYLGTKSIDETVTALQGIRNLLASGILIKPKPFMPLRPPKLPLIPVIPPANPNPAILQEVIPMKPLEYPELIGVEVPSQYSYKQMKSDGSMTSYTSRDGGDVIVTETKQSMPSPHPYIMERLKQACMQPIPVRPALRPVLMGNPRPIQYNVPMVPLSPPLPEISELSDVNVKPFSIREDINFGPLVKETDIIVPGPPIMLPPMPPAIILNKDVVGLEQSSMYRPHGSFIGPVPIGPYSSPHLHKAPHFFEPNRPPVILNTKGEVKVERIPNKKGHHYLGSLHHQSPIRKPHPVVVLEKTSRTMPLAPLPVMKRLENVVALAHAVHPPKVSAAYSFRVGSDFNKNISISTDKSTVNKENIHESPETTPSSNSYSYKQVGSDGVTTFTGNEVISNAVNIGGRLHKVSAIANQAGDVSESVKHPEAQLFTSPVSSSYVYKQINHNSAKPVTVVNVDNLKGFETEHIYTHQHVLADGSKKLCDRLHVNPVEVEKKIEEAPSKAREFMYIPPIINEVQVGMTPDQYSFPTAIPAEVRMPTVPVLKIDSEKLNVTTNFSYKQLTDGGMLTSRNGNIEIKEFISNSSKSAKGSETITTVKGTLTDNPIVVVDETFYTLKDKRDSSSSSGKRTSENVVSVEISDSTTKRHEKQMRGDIPDAMS